jgi:hypothetical protein
MRRVPNAGFIAPGAGAPATGTTNAILNPISLALIKGNAWRHVSSSGYLNFNRF